MAGLPDKPAWYVDRRFNEIVRAEFGGVVTCFCEWCVRNGRQYRSDKEL